MSYLIVVILGAIVGFIAGRYIKGNERGPAIDLVAGAVGACVAVLLSRVVGPAAAAGIFMSVIVTIIGAVATLFIARQVMKSKEVPAAPRTSRRF